MYSIGIDQNRVLIREASPEKITGRWREVVDEIIETCKEYLDSHLISLYIGGSVAHGSATENKSDVDSYAIVNLTRDEITDAYNNWVGSEKKRIDILFPFQRGVEIHLIPISQIGESKKFQMKVFSTLVYGKDFDMELPEYKLDKETIGQIRVNLGRDIEIARKELSDANDPKEIKKISAWISKRLIRSAGMMCIWGGNIFTMDIPFLVEMFTSYYPQQAEHLHKLLEYTENPSSEKQLMINLFDSFGVWLIEEDKKIFQA